MAFMTLCMLAFGIANRKKGEGRFKLILLISHFTALTGWVVEDFYWKKFPWGPGL